MMGRKSRVLGGRKRTSDEMERQKTHGMTDYTIFCLGAPDVSLHVHTLKMLFCVLIATLETLIRNNTYMHTHTHIIHFLFIKGYHH